MEVSLNHVIIGNGIAGVSAAESIRQLDGSGSIVMISDEPVAPYCRPMISLVLEGTISPAKLPIRDSDFYESLNITPVLGSRVARMDVDEKPCPSLLISWLPGFTRFRVPCRPLPEA